MGPFRARSCHPALAPVRRAEGLPGALTRANAGGFLCWLHQLTYEFLQGRGDVFSAGGLSREKSDKL